MRQRQRTVLDNRIFFTCLFDCSFVRSRLTSGSDEECPGRSRGSPRVSCSVGGLYFCVCVPRMPRIAARATSEAHERPSRRTRGCRIDRADFFASLRAVLGPIGGDKHGNAFVRGSVERRKKGEGSRAKDTKTIRGHSVRTGRCEKPRRRMRTKRAPGGERSTIVDSRIEHDSKGAKGDVTDDTGKDEHSRHTRTRGLVRARAHT